MGVDAAPGKRLRQSDKKENTHPGLRDSLKSKRQSSYERRRRTLFLGELQQRVKRRNMRQ